MSAAPELTWFSDPRAFRAQAGPFLLAREAEHNLIFGLLDQIQASRYPEFRLATLSQADQVVGCLLQTPPFPPVLSQLEAPARSALVAALAERDPRLGGLNGPAEVCAGFAPEWCARTGATAEVEMEQGIYELSEVIPPARPAPGRLRPMQAEDLELVTEWIEGFRSDTGVLAVSEAAGAARRRLEEGSLFLWEDGGRPVGMCAYSGPTPNGIRVNAVYTPAELRGRGYASAGVAALSQRLLDEGRRFCFLYTDLDNPTSNSIYQAIGYRRVGESVVLRFDYRA